MILELSEVFWTAKYWIILTVQSFFKLQKGLWTNDTKLEIIVIIYSTVCA